MKTKLIFIFISIFVIFMLNDSCEKDNSSSDNSIVNFKDTCLLVKTVTTFYNNDSDFPPPINYRIYDENGNNIILVCIVQTTINNISKKEFNSDNLLIKYTRINIEGEIEYYYTNEYYNNGNVKERNSFYLEGGDKITQAYEYNSNNKLTKYTVYKDDNLDYYYVYEYDESGNTIKKSEYDENNTITRYIIYEYDEYENNTISTTFDSNDSLLSSWEGEYMNNILVESNYYNKEGDNTHGYIYEYDNDGKLIENQLYFDGELSKITSNYYSCSNISENSVNANGDWNTNIFVIGGEQMNFGEVFSASIDISQSGSVITANSTTEGGLTGTINANLTGEFFTFNLIQNQPCVGTFKGYGVVNSTDDEIYGYYTGSDCNGEMIAFLIGNK